MTMKLTALILVCFSSVVYGEVDILYLSRRTMRRAPICTPATENRILCGSDCRTIVRCVRGQERIMDICGDAFCNDDSGNPVCTTEIGFECVIRSGNPYKCAGPGVFPDPRNCMKFHICVHKPGYTPNATPPSTIYDPSLPYNVYTVDCPNSTFYDAVSSSCIRAPACPQRFTIRRCNRLGDSFLVLPYTFASCERYDGSTRFIYPYLKKCQVNNILPCPAEVE